MAATTGTSKQAATTGTSKKSVDLKTATKISKSKRGFALTISVTNCTRTAMGKVIPIMNREFRTAVGHCSMIVWVESEENRKSPFATGKFTAESFDEEPLDRVGRMIIEALTRYDQEFRVEQSQRREIQIQRQMDYDQRQKRREEQEARRAESERRYAANERRQAEYERKKQEHEELQPYYSTAADGTTIGTAGTVKVVPSAPWSRKFKARTPKDAPASDEPFPALSDRVQKQIDFNAEHDDDGDYAPAAEPVKVSSFAKPAKASSAWSDEE